MVVAETEENWNERRIRNQKASEIKSKNIEGYKIYCDIRNISIPSSIDILRDKVTIEYYQKSYERSKIYEGWEDKQKAFCKKYHDLCSKHRDCDGRFTYEVNYSHITKTGSTSLSKFKIWQGFINSFSFDNEEMQPDYMIATKNNLPKFKDKKVYIKEYMQLLMDYFKNMNLSLLWYSLTLLNMIGLKLHISITIKKSNLFLMPMDMIIAT